MTGNDENNLALKIEELNEAINSLKTELMEFRKESRNQHEQILKETKVLSALNESLLYPS